MTQEETHYQSVIDTLIRQNRSFAIYRQPGEQQPHFVMQASGSACLFNSMEELNGQSGYVIAPFRVTADCPILLIRPDITELQSAKTSDDGTTSLEEIDETEATPYADAFARFIRPVKEGRFRKLVLSRKLTIKRTEGFSPAEAFFTASERYTRSYVYLCHTPIAGTWLGGTPEILLSGEAGRWQTVALAGTQPLAADEILPTEWDTKNREEQRLVASYIEEQLATLGIRPTREGPYTVRAAALAHLRSDFHFALPDNRTLGDVLALLHPTPAVCGLPKEEAYHFITRHEGYDRRYYSGFIGQLEPEGRTDLYVNLRCMCIGQRQLTLYAGGGLLASSTLNAEWQETEYKMQTMLGITQ
ncbi:MAG: isochorismate synthase [Tannerellaceae bacterium]